MTEKEKELILLAIDFLSPIDDRFVELVKTIKPGKRFMEFIKLNRIGGIIYTLLCENKIESELPTEIMDELYGIYKLNIQHNEDMRIMLRDIYSCLESCQFPYAFLKGSYLIPFLYKNGMRASNDIDILLSQKDIDILDACLVSNNFEQKVERNGELVAANRKEKLFVRMNYGELIPYFKEYNLPYIRNGCLDINISLDFQIKNNSDCVEEILKNTVDYTDTDGLRVHTLAPVTFFLHLCAHLYKEAKIYNWVEENRDTLLYKFCDIYLFLKKFSGEHFWIQLEKMQTLYGLEKACYYTLYTTQQLFNSLSIPPVNEFLKRNNPGDANFLNQVFWPIKNRLFQYDLSFIDWVFCENKLAYLKEIPIEKNDI